MRMPCYKLDSRVIEDFNRKGNRILKVIKVLKKKETEKIARPKPVP